MLVEIWNVLSSIYSQNGWDPAVIWWTSGASDNSTCVFFDETHLRVYIQNVSVCTGKTPTCFIHVNVLSVHTWDVSKVHTGVGFFSVPHHTPPPTHSNTAQHNTEHAREKQIEDERGDETGEEMKRDRDERRGIEMKREDRRDERRRAPHYKINCGLIQKKISSLHTKWVFLDPEFCNALLCFTFRLSIARVISILYNILVAHTRHVCGRHGLPT